MRRAWIADRRSCPSSCSSLARSSSTSCPVSCPTRRRRAAVAQARDEARPRPRGRPAGRVPGPPGRGQGARRAATTCESSSDIIERRVNSTGVSEPVVVDPGHGPGRRRAAGRHRTARRSASSSARPAGSTSSRSARRTADQPGPGPRPRRPVPAAVQRRPGRCPATQSAHGPERPAGRSTSCSRTTARSCSRDYTAGPRRRLLRDRPRRRRSSPRRCINERDPQRPRPDHARRDRRLSAVKEANEPRHDPPVRLAAVPDRRSCRATRSAPTLGEAVPQPEPARRRDRDRCSSSSSCSSTTGCRASSRASRSSTTRSWCYAIFRLIPVTLTLAGIAGFVLSVGMAVDANILIFERMKEELRARQVAARRRRGRLQPGLELDPRLERVEPDHRDDPVPLRLVDRSAASPSS